MVRQCVLDGDFDRFKKLVPFDENDAEDLYEELEDSFKALGALSESLLTEANRGSGFEFDVTNKLNSLENSDEFEFERQGSSLVSDIKAENINNKNVFYIECKKVPAQAGEIRCTINADGSLVKNKSGYDIDVDDTEKNNLHNLDEKNMMSIVNLFNSSDVLKNITSDYTKRQININLNKINSEELSKKFVSLMKERIISHYKFLGADYIAVGKNAESALFCRLDDVWDCLKLYDLRLRQKLGFSYSVDIDELVNPVGKFISTHFLDRLSSDISDYDIELDKYGFVENYKDSSRLLFYSKHNGNIPSNIKYDDDCNKVGSHIKCVTNDGNIAFDITEDRESNSRKSVNNKIKINNDEYMRFAVRTVPNRAIIQFLASLDIKDKSKMMTYNEFLNKIKS